MTCMTLTSDDSLEVSLVRMQRVYQELVVARGWSRSFARKRKERGSTMLGRLTRMTGGDSPNGLGLAA